MCLMRDVSPWTLRTIVEEVHKTTSTRLLFCSTHLGRRALCRYSWRSRG